MPVNAGRNSPSSCSPASVGATLRVVRSNQSYPDLFLESSNGVAERRLRHAKSLGCLGETPLSR